MRLKTSFDGDPWTYGEALSIKHNVVDRGKDGKKRMTYSQAAKTLGRSFESVHSFIARAELRDKAGRTEALYGRIGRR